MPTAALPLAPSSLSAGNPVGLIYQHHHGWLAHWLNRKLGGDACQAADLAQDTFVRVLQKDAAQLQAVRQPRAFLARIAQHLVIDHWRRCDIEQAWQEAMACQTDGLAPSPEQQAIAVQALCQMDAMLQAMAPRPRQAFVLSRIHGLGYAEIAVQLGVSERMVKKYMAAAMLHCIRLELA